MVKKSTSRKTGLKAIASIATTACQSDFQKDILCSNQDKNLIPTSF